MASATYGKCIMANVIMAKILRAKILWQMKLSPYRPQVFVGDIRFLLDTPIFALENLIFSLETPNFRWRPQYIHWRLPPDVH